MLRLGKFSGRIYGDIEVHNMKECGVCITEEQSVDEEFVKQHHLSDLQDCVKCLGCLMANGN